VIFHFDTDPAWIEIVVSWAMNKPELRRVTVFGSRVTGVRTPKDSPRAVPDLDLAIEIEGDPEDGWAEQSEWTDELEALLPIAVDCQWFSPPLTPCVADYMRKGSLVVFEHSS
jgi:predicted nucleotidyltransferase